MANPNPSPATRLTTAGPGRPKGRKNKITRNRVEQELRYLAFSDPIALFDRVAKGRRDFKLREITAMSEAMRRCIASVKVRHRKSAQWGWRARHDRRGAAVG